MAETLTCPSCGSANEAGRKFCGECGTALARACPSCGTANPPSVKFCGECGTALVTDRHKASASDTSAAGTGAGAPAAERRLVSVLFADLVGFTAASEGRDAEETRELLSRYFDVSRSIIERYGGTVEKFIGDAVMAVWGTPTATEDDAERAVRAALDLVAEIPRLHPGLAARAGVLTGEAAVTLGAEGQGMVAGDLVNTASRIQSAAEPGSVLVGEATKRASEAAVAFEDAGAHALKGKAEPVPLWRALRVVANRGGEGRSAGLEAPFVGRERELKLVKDLFHASADAGRAHLVLVSGPAGIGKSRLAWEFEKYADGLTRSVWWHRGRCPAYGEGVAYWALAEMVRGRAGILESEDAAAAAEKLAATVGEHVSDADDRRWVEPRLAHLLGLTEASFEREDLFAAWRLFFERLADTAPAVLVFEDLQWADAGLLDFVEYLVEWARGKPVFVVALARPELFERRPGFGAQTRGGFTGLALEPLSDEAMEALLAGLVPGVPESLRSSIRARADGIPLYAVETVRMLLDRGRLERADGAYRLVGEIGALAVPETLQALVAARLDGLSADERRLVQDASVLGKTFVVDALASVSGRAAGELEPLLRELVRKEILFLESDPRSAEGGQYGFLQDLLRRVAYDTLARRERRARHLAAAAFFETGWGGREQEVVEVVASHYLSALELEPEAEDAPALRAKARETLARAGERAASLGASAEAATSFARAAELAAEPLEEARLRARAGAAARAAGDSERATGELMRAIELFEEAGDAHAAARASTELAFGEFATGRLDQAIERMERAYATFDEDDPDEDVAYVLSQLARWLFFAGRHDACEERNERALEVAERLRLPQPLSHALITKGLLAFQHGRVETARALLRHALELALEHDVPEAALRGYVNLARVEDGLGNVALVEDLTRRSVELSRRLGDREAEWFSLGNLAETFVDTGKWDEVVRLVEDIPPGLETQASVLLANAVEVARHRGDLPGVEAALQSVAALQDSASVQDRLIVAGTRYAALAAAGRHEEALALAERARADLGSFLDGALWAELAIAEAALACGRSERAAEALAALEALPAGHAGRVRARAARFRAGVAAAQGDARRAEESFKIAAAAFREYDLPFELAATLLEQAEWLAGAGREAEAGPLLAEAGETFERLQARPWLQRVERLRRQAEVPA